MIADLGNVRKISRTTSAYHPPAPASVTSGGTLKFDRQRNLTMKSCPGRVEPLGRRSLRSKGSSNSSEDKVKQCKNCVRRLAEFFFTQVGVGAVVVCYTIVGAIIFQVMNP